MCCYKVIYLYGTQNDSTFGLNAKLMLLIDHELLEKICFKEQKENIQHMIRRYLETQY